MRCTHPFRGVLGARLPAARVAPTRILPLVARCVHFLHRAISTHVADAIR